MINLDDYGDIRAWTEGVESLEMICEDCDEPMWLVETDYTARLAVFECPVCEDRQRITVRGR
jgi:hypothetical protein